MIRRSCIINNIYKYFLNLSTLVIISKFLNKKSIKVTFTTHNLVI